MKKIGFLSFGHWSLGPQSRTRSGADALQQSIELAVAAEQLGADGAYFRVHHFARQLASPFPLLAAVGARTSRIEIGTAVIDMRYENPLYFAEDAGAADLIAGGRLQVGISRGSPEQVIEGWRYFGYAPADGDSDADMGVPAADRSSMPATVFSAGVFDHVAIAVEDLAASERFYRTVLSVLGAEPSYADAELVEWDDWDIGATDREHPVTRGLHVGFRAPSREAVDAFWQAGIDAGCRDDGAPGPRTIYGPDYYGGFLLDPDGNSAEAVHMQREDPVPDGRVDHLWIRVRDPAASKRFYMTIAPHARLRIGVDKPHHVQMVGENFSFSLIDDERPLTEHVHVAFPAQDDATVRAFHAAALAAGYEDHGGPGERPVYHPGYYGAFVLDPDGHNVEVVNHNR